MHYVLIGLCVCLLIDVVFVIAWARFRAPTRSSNLSLSAHHRAGKSAPRDRV